MNYRRVQDVRTKQWGLNPGKVRFFFTALREIMSHTNEQDTNRIRQHDKHVLITFVVPFHRSYSILVASRKRRGVGAWACRNRAALDCNVPVRPAAPKTSSGEYSSDQRQTEKTSR